MYLILEKQAMDTPLRSVGVLLYELQERTDICQIVLMKVVYENIIDISIYNFV